MIYDSEGQRFLANERVKVEHSRQCRSNIHDSKDQKFTATVGKGQRFTVVQVEIHGQRGSENQRLTAKVGIGQRFTANRAMHVKESRPTWAKVEDSRQCRSKKSRRCRSNIHGQRWKRSKICSQRWQKSEIHGGAGQRFTVV